MLALILIILGFSLIVIGYGVDTTEVELPEGLEEEEYQQEYPEGEDGNGEGNGQGGHGGGTRTKILPLNIFGYQVSPIEIIGYVLVGCGVILLFIKR